MINVRKLKKLLNRIPDDATLVAYEGEGVGLSVKYKDSYGWIETGLDHNEACDESQHQLEEITDELINILRRSREYVHQANIEAEIKHDNEGEYYLDGAQYEIMEETKQLMEQIDQEIKRLEGE